MGTLGAGMLAFEDEAWSAVELAIIGCAPVLCASAIDAWKSIKVARIEAEAVKEAAQYGQLGGILAGLASESDDE